MPLTIQLGEVGDRLRRALSLKGRIPTALDETVVPVVQLVDASQPPYAKDPAHGSSRHTRAALAANFSHIGWQAAVGSILIVDSVLVSNPNAAPSTVRVGITTNPTHDADSSIICVSRPFISPGNPARIASRRYDRVDPTQQISANEGSVTLAAAGSILLLGPWVLQAPDLLNAMALVLVPEIVNQAVEGWARVREFGAVGIDGR
jgi:hypothetical protein